eukprot:jgi/Ulvmu1/11009/UM007_0189.1
MAVSVTVPPHAVGVGEAGPGAPTAPRTMEGLRDAARAALATAQRGGGDAARLLSHLRPLAPEVRWLVTGAGAAAAAAAGGDTAACARIGREGSACGANAAASAAGGLAGSMSVGTGEAAATGADGAAARPLSVAEAARAAAPQPLAAAAALSVALPEEADLFGEPLAVPDAEADTRSASESAGSVKEGEDASPALSMPGEASTAEANLIAKCGTLRAQVLATLHESRPSGGIDCAPAQHAAHAGARALRQRLAATVASVLRAADAQHMPGTEPATSPAAAGQATGTRKPAPSMVVAAFVCAIMRHACAASASEAEGQHPPACTARCLDSVPAGGGADLRPAAEALDQLLGALRVPQPAAHAVLTDAVMPRAAAALQHAWPCLSQCEPWERDVLLAAMPREGSTPQRGLGLDSAVPLPALRAVLCAARQSPTLSTELAGVANTLTLHADAAPGERAVAVCTAAESTERSAAATAAALAPAAAVAGHNAVYAHLWQLAAAQPAHAHHWVAVCGALTATSGGGGGAAAAAAWAAAVSRDAAAARLETDTARRAAVGTAAAICASPPLVPLADFVASALLPLLGSARSAGVLLTALGCLAEAVSCAGGATEFTRQVGVPFTVRTLLAAACCAASRWGWCGGPSSMSIPAEPLHPHVLRALGDAATLAEDLLTALVSAPFPLSPDAACAAASALLQAAPDIPPAGHPQLAAVLGPLSDHVGAELQRAVLRCSDRSTTQQLKLLLAQTQTMRKLCTYVGPVKSLIDSAALHSTAAHTAAIANALITSTLLPTPLTPDTTQAPQHAIASSRIAQNTRVQHAAAQQALQQLPKLAPAEAAAHLTAAVALLLPEYPVEKPAQLLAALVALRCVLCSSTAGSAAPPLPGLSPDLHAESGAIALAAAAAMALMQSTASLQQCLAVLCAVQGSPHDQPHSTASNQSQQPEPAAEQTAGARPWACAWVLDKHSRTGSAAASAVLRVLCALCVHAASSNAPDGTGDERKQHAAPSSPTNVWRGTGDEAGVSEASVAAGVTGAVHAAAGKLLRRASVAQQLGAAVSALMWDDARRWAAADIGGVRAALLRLLEGLSRDAAQVRAAAVSAAHSHQPESVAVAGAGVGQSGVGVIEHGHGIGEGALHERPGEASAHVARVAAVGDGNAELQRLCAHACLALAQQLRSLPVAVSEGLERPLDDITTAWQL